LGEDLPCLARSAVTLSGFSQSGLIFPPASARLERTGEFVVGAHAASRRTEVPWPAQHSRSPARETCEVQRLGLGLCDTGAGKLGLQSVECVQRRFANATTVTSEFPRAIDQSAWTL
jgi:hypothetical protein